MSTSKYLAIGAFALLVALVAFVVVGQATGPSETEARTENETVRQEVSERTWVNVGLIDSVLVSGGVSLYRPVALRSHDGDLFVADVGDMSIKRFETTGDLVAVYGEGVGQAPGQFQQIVDVAFDDDRVWIPDATKRTISWFKPSGEYVDEVKLDFSPTRIVPVDDGLVVMEMGPNLFHHVTSEGSITSSFGQIVENQAQQALALNGYLLPRRGGGMIYAPAYASYLYYYSSNGELDRIVETIDDLEFPGMEERSIGGRSVTTVGRGNDRRVADTQVIPEIGELHQVMAIKNADGEYTTGSFDVYDWESGRYIRSYRIPFFTRGATKIDERIYAVRDTTIVVLGQP